MQKIESYSDELRISEGAIYARLVLNFTEDVPKPQDEYDLIKEVDIVTQTKNSKRIRRFLQYGIA